MRPVALNYDSGMRLALALVALWLVSGCKPQQPSTPEAAYRAFVAQAEAAREGRPSKDFMLAFDSSTRAALLARAKAAAGAAGKGFPEDAADQMSLGGFTPSAVASVEVVQQAENSALLRITTDGGEQGTVRMVREEGQWRVHLDALDVADAGAPAPAPVPAVVDAGSGSGSDAGH
ncbi:MAG: hypothetical protein JST54_02305 [Deltaproteobacteria bacterium]|nr:hypothetical protein [Deltaproteobacteria bacterium]